MAINKSALIRYKTLDKCFGNPGKRYFIEDLIAECEDVLREIDPSSKGISRRQVLSDIRFMESGEGWSVDLVRYKEGRRVFYRYADLSFSIDNMPLNELELKQLQSALNALSRFEGLPQFEWIGPLLPKLLQAPSSSTHADPLMQFEHNPYLKGIERLGELYSAIHYRKILSVMYQPYECKDPYKVTVHPYFLKQYNSRWFLFGYNPEAEKYNWNLAIDRIVSIQEDSGDFHENTAIDWNEYFEDIIGVTRPDGANIENVVLRFNGKTAMYIETKPLHGSQRSKWLGKETLEVYLKLMINYELERLILSYADSVTVIQPQRLADIVRARLSSALENYPDIPKNENA